MSPSKILLYFCFSFIGGIFLSSLVKVNLFILLVILILALILISLFWRRRPALIGFCLLFLILGFWRYQAVKTEVDNNELKKFMASQKLELIGQVVAEPDIRDTYTQLVIGQINILNQPIKGKILLKVGRYPGYQYGDQLKITGQLLSPMGDTENYDYQNYLAKDGIYALMNFPEIELLKKGNYPHFLSFIYAKILQFKGKLRQTIYQNLSPPQSSLLAAMLLGDKSRLSSCSQKEIINARERGEVCLKLKEKLNLTGLRHITAISGMHITILSMIMMQFLIALGLWRQQAFYLTLIFLIFYLIMIGLPASAVRAGIMAGFLLLAQHLGRLSLSSRIIVLTAVLMLLVNPLLLRADVGFQLSFLAALGIIHLSPFFKKWFNFLKIGTIKETIATTFSAQVFTLPLLIYNFGYLSSVAVITNLLIVPLLPFILITGFMFSLAGLVLPIIGWIMSWPAWLLLTYLVKIIEVFSRVPAIYFTISWFWLILFYLILIFLVWRIKKHYQLAFLKF